MNRYEIAQLVRNFVASDPKAMSVVVEAATAGVSDALDQAKARATELDAAWRMALVLLTADRVMPEMKKSMARTLLPVLARTENVACRAERDAKAWVEALS